MSEGVSGEFDRELSKGEPVTLTFSSQEIARLISSDAFTSALAIAADETQTSGNETSFHLDVNANRTAYIPEVRVGEADSTLRGEEIAVIDDGYYMNDPYAFLISFHFHPDPLDAIIPSDTDLKSLVVRPGQEKRGAPLMGIGRVNGDLITILFVQAKYGALAVSDIENYTELLDLDEVYDNSPQEKVTKVLDEAGIASKIVEYSFINGRCVPKEVNENTFSDMPALKVTVQ